jgi:protein-tyrosine phosphatase
MIDIHNHILFGLDDGCKTIDESLMMLSKAVEAGVKELILTPHYGPLRGYVKSHDFAWRTFEELQSAVTKQRIPLRLHLGREIDEIDDLTDLLNQNKLETLAKTKYVLLDFGMKKTDVDEYIYELVISGYKPIIAHPERYTYVDNFKDFNKWRQTGALLQLNASSMFHPKNKDEKKKTKYLLKHGLVDLVASDAHRNPKRFTDLRVAIKKINKKYPQNQLKFDRILGGEDFEDI